MQGQNYGVSQSPQPSETSPLTSEPCPLWCWFLVVSPPAHRHAIAFGSFRSIQFQQWLYAFYFLEPRIKRALVRDLNAISLGPCQIATLPPSKAEEAQKAQDAATNPPPPCFNGHPSRHISRLRH